MWGKVADCGTDSQNDGVSFGFIGRFDVTIDSKSRLVIAACFRGLLPDAVVLHKNRSQMCIDVLPPSVWNDYLARLGRMPMLDRRAQRFLTIETASAVEAKIDRMGRLLLSADMRGFIGVNAGDDAVVTGAGDRIKIWNTAVWEKFACPDELVELEESLFKDYEI